MDSAEFRRSTAHHPGGCEVLLYAVRNFERNLPRDFQERNRTVIKENRLSNSIYLELPCQPACLILRCVHSATTIDELIQKFRKFRGFLSVAIENCRRSNLDKESEGVLSAEKLQTSLGMNCTTPHSNGHTDGLHSNRRNTSVDTHADSLGRIWFTSRQACHRALRNGNPKFHGLACELQEDTTVWARQIQLVPINDIFVGHAWKMCSSSGNINFEITATHKDESSHTVSPLAKSAWMFGREKLLRICWLRDNYIAMLELSFDSLTSRIFPLRCALTGQLRLFLRPDRAPHVYLSSTSPMEGCDVELLLSSAKRISNLGVSRWASGEDTDGFSCQVLRRLEDSWSLVLAIDGQEQYFSNQLLPKLLANSLLASPPLISIPFGCSSDRPTYPLLCTSREPIDRKFQLGIIFNAILESRAELLSAIQYGSVPTCGAPPYQPEAESTPFINSTGFYERAVHLNNVQQVLSDNSCSLSNCRTKRGWALFLGLQELLTTGLLPPTCLFEDPGATCLPFPYILANPTVDLPSLQIGLSSLFVYLSRNVESAIPLKPVSQIFQHVLKRQWLDLLLKLLANDLLPLFLEVKLRLRLFAGTHLLPHQYFGTPVLALPMQANEGVVHWEPVTGALRSHMLISHLKGWYAVVRSSRKQTV